MSWVNDSDKMYRYTYKIRAILGVSLLFFGLAIAADKNLTRMLELARSKYGESGFELVQQWHQTLIEAAPLEEQQQLALVNGFFNKHIQFLSDEAIWREKDYWATPLETLGQRKGDCEDYVIAKYFSLLKLGVAPEKLRLVYVKAKINGLPEAHMVLAYYPSSNAVPIILDNLRYDMLPATQRRDLKPVYSFNSAGLWVGQEQTARSKDPASRMSRWQDVLTRMQIEGFQL